MIKRQFFGENGKYVDDGEPVYLSGRVVGGTPRFHAKQEVDRNATSVFDDRESSISKMWRDKKMVKLIKEGKGSDKGLKREAEAIERENSKKPKEKWYAEKRANIARMRKEFKIPEEKKLKERLK